MYKNNAFEKLKFKTIDLGLSWNPESRGSESGIQNLSGFCVLLNLGKKLVSNQYNQYTLNVLYFVY